MLKQEIILNDITDNVREFSRESLKGFQFGREAMSPSREYLEGNTRRLEKSYVLIQVKDKMRVYSGFCVKT